MPRGASRKVAGVVRNYMNVEAATENHVMQLEEPYHFKGQTYTKVDLNGIADLNSMNESEAENRLARAGFMVTETSFNYLFACILASMATGLPEEFFTGLPLREVLKLKNAVNDSGFSSKGRGESLTPSGHPPVSGHENGRGLLPETARRGVYRAE